MRLSRSGPRMPGCIALDKISILDGDMAHNLSVIGKEV